MDPLYVFSAADIAERFYAVVDLIIDQVKAAPDDWTWRYHRSPDHLKENRCAALRSFVGDFDKGKAEGRYVIGELPHLEFPDCAFDLALCSHFLFLYSDHLTFEFHLASIREMLRVANEIRVFPLLTLGLEVSPYVAPLVSDLTSHGFIASVEVVPYEVQRGGHHMLQVRLGT
ncbi:MAG: SAM-dependent methyltransferase [Acidiferrobacter sp.]